ncbi:MAG: ABC transporter permease [Gammaproteobacteria bacterium]|nr:ABC transporter permease [Gammaproteobacteria bacterium]
MTDSLQLIFALAWRNLWRNRRRTLLILFAIVLGVWAMIVTAAFMRGMIIQMVDDTADNLVGHIQIHHPLYLDDPVIANSFLPNSELLDHIAKDSRIESWSDRIRLPAVVVSERDTGGVSLVGIDPQREAAVSFIADSIVEGRFLESPDDKGIVIGKALAEQLETGLGKRLVLMSQDKNNEIADRGVRVVGIFKAPLVASEKGFVFLGRNTAAKMLGLENDVSEIVIRVVNTDTVDQVLADNKSVAEGLDIKSWMEVEPLLELMVSVYDSSAVIWHLIVFLAMAFGIVNTLLMAVFERTREFGLFQALGQKPRFILMQVWLEAILMLLVGLVFGNLVSWLTVLAIGDGIDVSAFASSMELMNLSNIIPVIIVFKDLLVANITVIILGMLTGLYPAWRASKLVPADALTRV